MAIYQLGFEMLPKQGVLKYHEEIPKRLILKEDKEGFIDNDFEKYWNLDQISSNQLINEIDVLLNRATWGCGQNSVNWKTETELVDNDAWILFDENTKMIKELSFRVDLREKGLRFLEEMLQIAIKYDFLLISNKGFIINPNKKEVSELIQRSNPYKFVSNPRQFLNDFANHKIKLERDLK